MFKKIATMYDKGNSSKIKRSTCNVLIEASDICNVLPRSVVSNRLIVVKLKRDPKYRDMHILNQFVTYFFQTLTELKSDNKLYKHISIAKRLLNEKLFIFSAIFEIQTENDSVLKKLFRIGKK